jgi:hypothetical protein
MPLARRGRELMPVMRADDPETVVDRPLSTLSTLSTLRTPRTLRTPKAPMRLTEIQKKRNLRRREVALLHRYAKVARAGEVSVDVGAQAGIRGPLHGLPAAEFGPVFAARGFHLEIQV